MASVTPQERPITQHQGRVARALVGGLLAIGTVAAATGSAQAAYLQPSGRPAAGHGSTRLAAELRGDLEAYLQARGQAEHVSAAALSVSIPGRRSTIDVRAGTTRFGGTQPVPKNSLWQIGSNTKAFTSVLLLKLEAQHRLSINDTLGRWLPQYPQWRDVTIRSLLNMTSGIPPYDGQPAFAADFAADPYRYFSKEQLVRYATAGQATSGYHYSNTNYILAEMIIEKASRDSYRDQLYCRIIRPLGLHDTFYRPHLYPPQVTSRETAAYFFDDTVPELSGLLGRDVSGYTLSWTRGAGGIIATTRDMTIWERALYSGALLPAAQQAELLSLVSKKSGQPIERTSPDDPEGFGLGVMQKTGPTLGTIWMFEGGTLGVRTIHLYLPGSGAIMAIGLNSNLDPNNDAISALAVAVNDTLVASGAIPPASASAGQP